MGSFHKKKHRPICSSSICRHWLVPEKDLVTELEPELAMATGLEPAYQGNRCRLCSLLSNLYCIFHLLLLPDNLHKSQQCRIDSSNIWKTPV
jgi:hypothetical protein